MNPGFIQQWSAFLLVSKCFIECWRCILLRDRTSMSFLGGYPLSIYAKFSEKLTFLTPWYTHTCAYQGVRNVSFSENFPYVINGWPLHAFCLQNKLLFVMHAAVTYVKSNLLFADHMTSLLLYFSITQMWWKYKKSGLVASTFSLDHCNFTQKWKTRS